MVAKSTHLRVAAPDEVPAQRKTIVEAAESNDSLALLVAMRRRLASAVQDEDTPARDLASLSRRLIEVDKSIESRRVQERQEAEGDEVADGEFDAEAI